MENPQSPGLLAEEMCWCPKSQEFVLQTVYIYIYIFMKKNREQVLEQLCLL